MSDKGLYYEHPKVDAQEDSKSMCPECGKKTKTEAFPAEVIVFHAHRVCVCGWESKPWRFAFS